MGLVFICGVVGEDRELEVAMNTIGSVDNASNIFQKRLISGFKSNGEDIDVFSLPFIGAYPKYYKKIFFNNITQSNKDIQYISFNNIWGYKSLSRALKLKKIIRKNLKKDINHRIIIYSAHTPFLYAAKYIKKHYKDTNITLIVLDLPQYMVLNKRKTLIYKAFKYFDIKLFNHFCRYVDSYMVLTKQMLDSLRDGHKKKSLVVEGISEHVALASESDDVHEDKVVLYAGKLNENFGVMNLIKAIIKLKQHNFKLIICGSGELEKELKCIARLHRNIIIKGQVSEKIARDLIKEADVLVNPRQNNSEYTKYSFPSKNIEYLTSGKSVVAYMLDGVPKEYENFLFVPKDNTVEGLMEAILEAENNKEEAKRKHSLFVTYAQNNIEANKICEKILRNL